MNLNGNIKREPPENAEMRREKKIDSTASIKHIAKVLSERERFSKAYKFYNQLLVPRRSYNIEAFHYSMPGHPLKTFNENWDGEVPPNYFEPFLYRSTMPTVISEIRNMDKSDPITHYIKVKTDWQMENVNIKRPFSARCKLNYLNDEVVQCPKYLIDLAYRLENDPDPHFDATFNWYYSGNGNMQLVCVDCVDYLLHSEMSSVYLSRFNKENMKIETNATASFSCDNDANILETICSSLNVVVLRTKCKIFILKISQTDDTLALEKLKAFESSSSFTSISFDKHHTNILYTTTIDDNLTIVNIDRMTGKTVKLQHHRESLLNNWNCVVGVDRGSYMHIEKNAITLYDKRTNSTTTSWTGLKNIVDMVLCNDISMARHCEDSPSLYFATDHLLFLMDTRASKQTNLKVVQRWMHGLRCSPTYMSIGKSHGNKEFLVLSSQWCQDTCVVSNYADSVVSSCRSGGMSMPYHPPSVMDVLKEARLKMLCFDIHSPIECRLVTSTAGLVVMEQNENCCILTQNTLGDIFLRTLYPQYMESDIVDKSVTTLHEWSRAFKIERNAFEVTGIENIAPTWLRLKKVPDTYDFGPKNIKDYYDKSKIYDTYNNEELIPELLDVWRGNGQTEQSSAEQDSLAVRCYSEDSDSV